MPREFYLYNEIANSDEGWFGPEDVTTPSMLNDALSECEPGDVFNLYVNSPGGSVFAAVAMCAMIDRARAKGVTVEAYIDGMAASAASFLIMAADAVHAYKSSFLMIHKPWSFCIGNANDMHKEADTLDKLEKDSLYPLYMRKAKISQKDLQDYLDRETWLGASEMEEMFEIDVIEESKEVKQFSADVFAKYHYHAPEALVADTTPADEDGADSDDQELPFPDPPEKSGEEKDNKVDAKARERPKKGYYQELNNQIDCI